MLLSQLTNGSYPSQATIQLAIAYLMEVVTAEEKQLIPQLIHQIVGANPVFATANPQALQVEAIRIILTIILTTRGQQALTMGVPTMHQIPHTAQPQLTAPPVLTRSCGRGILSTVRSGLYQQNQPRGRGVRRGMPRNSAAAEAN